MDKRPIQVYTFIYIGIPVFSNQGKYIDEREI
jgi:hypothetical protein